METHDKIKILDKIENLISIAGSQSVDALSHVANGLNELKSSIQTSLNGNTEHKDNHQLEVGLIVFEKNGQIVEINEMARNLLGISPENLSSKALTHYISADDVFRFIDFTDSLFDLSKINNSFSAEFSLVSEKGSIYRIETICKPVVSENGAIRCRFSFIDISDYKFTQKTLTQSERKYRITYERANIGIAHIALDGYYISVNPRLCDMFGYSRDEMLNMSVNQLLDPKGNFENNFLIEQLISRKCECVTFEEKFHHKNHNPIWVNVSIICVYDEINAPLFLIAFYEDITQKKIAEKTICKWSNIFKYADWGVAVLNINDYTLDMINPAFAKMHGYTLDEIRGKTLFELIVPESIAIYKEKIADISNRHAHSFEAQHFNIAGNALPILVDLASIVDKEGNIEYTVLCIQDISQQKEIERKLIEAEKKSESSEKIKNSLLSNISHEIRTPLNGILGFSELLKRTDLSGDKKDQFINIIQKNGHQLLNFMTGLLDLSRIEAGALERKSSSYQLNLLLIEIYSFYHANKIIDDKKDLKFFLNSGLSDLDSYIYVDVDKLKQILANLIDNAIKFTTEGFIEFGYSVKAENLLFYVRDTGCGISAEDKEYIFSMFHPEEQDNLMREFNGRGLGLTITKAFVELLGGDIWVESVKDEGSTFYFTIPYYQAQAPISTIVYHQEPVELSYDFSNKTVLIVEDDEISYYLYSELLADCNANVLHAANGTDAIEMFQQTKDIDLIILDIQLPGADGITVTKVIRMENQIVPIIAQTARAFEEFETICLDAGCTEYHTKPMDTEKMLRIMAKYLT